MSLNEVPLDAPSQIEQMPDELTRTTHPWWRSQVVSNATAQPLTWEMLEQWLQRQDSAEERARQRERYRQQMEMQLVLQQRYLDHIRSSWDAESTLWKILDGRKPLEPAYDPRLNVPEGL